MINYTYTPDYYNDYIKHHGIDGMHWGEKNGPPYPLGRDISTGNRLKKKAEKLKKKTAIAMGKASKANKKAAQAGNSTLHPLKAKKKEKYEKKAFKYQSKADKLNSKLNKTEAKYDKLVNKNIKKENNEVDKIVKKARETGKYDMEFLEKGLDTDQRTGNLLKGKRLDDAYRKYLNESGKASSGKSSTKSNNKPSSKPSEISSNKQNNLEDAKKKYEIAKKKYENSMKNTTGKTWDQMTEKEKDAQIRKETKAESDYAIAQERYYILKANSENKKPKKSNSVKGWLNTFKHV